MHNYLQNFFLIFLFFFILSSIYAMENNELNINAELTEVVNKAENSHHFAQEDMQKIKECIIKGANPNYKTKNGWRLICLAVHYLNIDLLKCLIERNANIDVKDDYQLFNPLKCAIDKLHYENGLEIVKELCKAGASLILRDFSPKNNIFTVFHYLTLRKMPKEDIEAIITHTRFYDRAADEQLKKQIMTALLVFNRLSLKFPQEIRLRILSNLALDFPFGFNGRFCRKLGKMNCESFITCIEKRVENIDKTLQFVDVNSMTPAQCWANLNNRMHNNDAQYAAEVQSLLDGSKLRKDMKAFKKSFQKNVAEIPEDNLVLKICNVQKLLNKKLIFNEEYNARLSNNNQTIKRDNN